MIKIFLMSFRFGISPLQILSTRRSG